jgi:uncharacterized protein (DUF58 family)
MTPSGRELRITTLLVAPAVSAFALLLRPVEIVSTTAPVLAILWLIMATTLIVRSIQVARDPGHGSIDLRPAWHHLDVLTATGSSVMWTSAAALIASASIGWASLAVLGVLGLGVVLLAALWTALAAGGDVPWRHAAISRAIVPEVAVEGDRLQEQVHIAGVRIAAGMRLFATGRAFPDSAIARYAIGSECSRAEVRQTSDLGTAVRGEHSAPPLTFWLGDVLGLTRTQTAEYGAARFSVLPRPATVDGARALLGSGGEDASTEPTQRQPTEGTFRIREYAAGDDTRRIHWVRSLQANRLVVRLPDEIPQEDPAVRVILDSELWAVDLLSCRAPRELLDALVRVWLGVARALTDGGSRVTLVAVADQSGAPAMIEGSIGLRSSREAQRLGGRVVWQTAIPLTQLLATGGRPVKHVVVSSRPRKLPAASQAAWVVVPEVAWTSPEVALPARSVARLPFPAGSAENRLTRRRRVRRHRETMWNDRTIFSQLMFRTEWATFSGDLLARPHRGRVALEVIP